MHFTVLDSTIRMQVDKWLETMPKQFLLLIFGGIWTWRCWWCYLLVRLGLLVVAQKKENFFSAALSSAKGEWASSDDFVYLLKSSS